MRVLLAFSFINFQLFMLAQVPDGRLYMTTGTGGVTSPLIGYVEYPEGIYTVIDTVQITDFLVVDDKLIAATLGDVVIYDTSGYQHIATIPNVIGRRLEVSSDKLVITSLAYPHLRIYDLQTRYFLFAVDTPHLAHEPSDLLVADDKAFVLLGDSIVIVDLLMEQVDTTLHTPHPFSFGGFNFYIVEAGNYLYIPIEYATGAIRSSLIRMNKSTYDFDTVFHLEGHGGTRKPVVAGDRIYLYAFGTYYDISNDSLHLSPNTWNPFALDYDEKSESIFLHHPPDGINYYQNGSFSDTVTAGQNVLKALFVQSAEKQDTVNHIADLNGLEMNLYPNPANYDITISFAAPVFLKSVIIYNSVGVKVTEQFINKKLSQYNLSTGELEKGIYFLEIGANKGRSTAKFVK